MELTISLKKSMVTSPAMHTWDIVDEKNEVYESFDKVCSYKYLGIDTHNTMFRTSTAKQVKTVTAARRYRGACRYLSRRGPDVVDVSVCAWRNVAIPALLFGVESVIFSNTNIEKLEREQARWAKETLNLPQYTSNLSAQLLLGAPPVRQLLYHQQIKFFMRLNSLPSKRFAAQALREHEVGGWKSKYLEHIHDLQLELNMLQLPIDQKCLEVAMMQYGEQWLEERLRGVSCLAVAASDLEVGRLRSAREGEGWTWVNRAILGASGVRLNGRNKEWRPMCEDDMVPNTDMHSVMHCSRTKRERRDTGISLYFSSCAVKNITEERAYSNLILGLDWKGAQITLADYQERGVSLGKIFKAAKSYGVGGCKLNGQFKQGIL